MPRWSLVFSLRSDTNVYRGIVDVETDVANAAELRGCISQLLMERNARFSQENIKLTDAANPKQALIYPL